MINAALAKSDFFRHVLTLLGGSALAQLVPLLISPLLTRLYSPESFGVYAVYIAIVSIFVVFATGQYENAILLPEDDAQARALTIASTCISVVFSLLMLVVIALFGTHIDSLFKVQMEGMLYLVPAGVLATGLFNILNYWHIRREKYGFLSRSAVVSSVGNSGVSIALGYQALNAAGLVVAQLFGLVLAVVLLVCSFIRGGRSSAIRWAELRAVCVRYKRFPQVTVLHGFFSNLSNNLPAVIFTTYFSPTVAGFYFLAFRVSAIPLNILGNSFYQVFFQKLSRADDKKCFYRARFLQVSALLVPVFVALWFLLPLVFGICFGEQWIEAGEYARILLPLLYMKFLSSVFATAVYICCERQIENFLFGVLVNACICVSLLYGAYVGSVDLALWLMVMSNGFVILIKLVRCNRILDEATP